MKKTAGRMAKSRQDRNLLYEEIWCVFDVDEHPLLAEAKHQASANHIKTAISNPCFELWVLLHFQDQRAHIARSVVQSLCRERIPGYKKLLPCEALAPYLADAMNRAGELGVCRR
jgi:hypothetical protein